MPQNHPTRQAFLLVAATVVAGAWFLGVGRQTEVAGTPPFAGKTAETQPLLISIQPFPDMQGEMCEWLPASAPQRLTLALQQDRPASPGAGLAPTGAPSAVDADRAPVRVIRDSYPTYSAVAVDPVRNEIVLQDENLFQILVYDRLANTPPAASMTEPKRVIGGSALTVAQLGLHL